MNRDEQLQKICRSLSMQCRYAGNVRRFYSVAEHTVHMVQQVRQDGRAAHVQLPLWLHDVPEHATGDIIWPVKNVPEITAAYSPLERVAMRDACQALGVPRAAGDHALVSADVKIYDRAILAAEAKFVANPQPGWSPYDAENPLHVAFGGRLKASASCGHNFDLWAHAMVTEFETIMEGLHG